MFNRLNGVSVWKYEWLHELWKSLKRCENWGFLKIPSSAWMGKKAEKRQISLKLWMISIGKIDTIDSQLRWIFCVWMEWIHWKMLKELRAKLSDPEENRRTYLVNASCFKERGRTNTSSQWANDRYFFIFFYFKFSRIPQEPLNWIN